MSKDKNILPGVIVIGGHVQGLGIARIYGKNNIPVILLDNTRINLTRHSKYCQEFIKYENNKLLELLLIFGESRKYNNWLLMPTNDRDVEILSKNKRDLSNFFKVSSESFDILQNFFNKRLTYKLVEDLKISIPKTWMPDSWRDIEEMDIRFPCIIKPAIMHTFYSKTKKKVFVCNNGIELKDNYKKALALIPKEEVIIQDIIPGNSEHQYSVCFMFDGKKPLVTLSVRRSRQHPPDFGNATTYAETVEISKIIENAKKILKKVDYKGVCEVEFKFDIRDDKFKFLEVNPRTWKWHSIAEKSNSPILMSLYHNLYDLEPIIKNKYDKASFKHLITDIPTILKMKLLKIKIPRTKLHPKYAVWDSRDLKPAIFELLYLPYLVITRN